jgi:hypothetical protein
MKTTVYFISIILILGVIISCNGKYTNEEQRIFDEIRREYIKKYNEANNDIVQQELYTQYKQKVCDFFKSIQEKNSLGVGVKLDEWDGKITDIKFIAGALDFFLTVQHSCGDTTAFYCVMDDSGVLPTNGALIDTKANFNKIYSTIKTLKYSDSVVFSGNLAIEDICEDKFGHDRSYLASLFKIYITDLRKK